MAIKFKSQIQQQLLQKQQRDDVLHERLAFSKKRFKKFDEVIALLYKYEDLSAHYNDARIRTLHYFFEKLNSKNNLQERATFKNILLHINKNSKIINEEVLMTPLFNVLKYKKHWINNLYHWIPNSKKGKEQLHELLTFLFCKYAVPNFMYKCFNEEKNVHHIDWFIHLGNGKSVKELKNLNTPFTQKMGHYFLQAPNKPTITEVVRWAQVKGLNGNDELANRISSSWLGHNLTQHEEFWLRLIQIIIESAMFPLDKITEVLDFVREQKRIHQHYSLHGRTGRSILRQSDDWHQRFMGGKLEMSWNPSGINAFKYSKQHEKLSIEEITASKILIEEGKHMKHCVGSYATYCAKGKTAIFSMRKYIDGVLLETLATIEVNLSLKRIVQAKAKMNKPISTEAHKYMSIWAAHEQLLINEYL